MQIFLLTLAATVCLTRVLWLRHSQRSGGDIHEFDCVSFCSFRCSQCYDKIGETRVSFADPRYKWIRLISRLCFFVGLASLLLPRTFALDRLLSKDFSIGSPSPLSDVLISSLKWFLEREMASERDSKISSISSCRLRRPIFDALYRGDIPRATRARKLIC